MNAICQRCGESKPNWRVHTCKFHVGELQNWQLQLCELCETQVQMLVRAALLSMMSVLPQPDHDPKCDCGQPGVTDVEKHASDCNWRLAQPPAGLPRLDPQETAVCEISFANHPPFSFRVSEIEPLSDGRVQLRIDGPMEAK